MAWSSTNKDLSIPQVSDWISQSGADVAWSWPSEMHPPSRIVLVIPPSIVGREKFGIPSHIPQLVFMIRDQTSSRENILEDAIRDYREGKLSLGRAAEICNKHYDEMIDLLRKRGIRLRFGPDSVEEAEEDERSLVGYLERR